MAAVEACIPAPQYDVAVIVSWTWLRPTWKKIGIGEGGLRGLEGIAYDLENNDVSIGID
jgi:hypothetical protein